MDYIIWRPRSSDENRESEFRVGLCVCSRVLLPFKPVLVVCAHDWQSWCFKSGFPGGSGQTEIVQEGHPDRFGARSDMSANLLHCQKLEGKATGGAYAAGGCRTEFGQWHGFSAESG